MPKVHTFPVIYDGLNTLDTGYLSRTKMLRMGMVSGWAVLTWRRRAEIDSQIGVLINTAFDRREMQVRYTYQGNRMEYTIRLEAKQANIGRGYVWYFRCPVTGKRCRKLYQYNGRYTHRTVIRGMYEKQTYSKHGRYLDWAMGHLYGVDKYWEELYKKGFRKTYAGKPTRRYEWLRAKIAASENVNVKHIDNQIGKMFGSQTKKRKQAGFK